jgi:hypothetical protein
MCQRRPPSQRLEGTQSAKPAGDTCMLRVCASRCVGRCCLGPQRTALGCVHADGRAGGCRTRVRGLPPACARVLRARFQRTLARATCKARRVCSARKPMRSSWNRRCARATACIEYAQYRQSHASIAHERAMTRRNGERAWEGLRSSLRSREHGRTDSPKAADCHGLPHARGCGLSPRSPQGMAHATTSFCGTRNGARAIAHTTI